MRSFLITRRMSPELSARVAASLGGRGGTSGSRLVPRVLSLLRLGMFLTIACALVWLVVSRRRANQDLESARAELLARVRREAVALTPRERNLGGRVKPWLEREAGIYAGDLLTAELRAAGGLAAVLARQSVYVRGPVASFVSQRGIEESAAASGKDPLVLCLLSPAASRTEKALLAKVRAAYRSSEAAVSTAQVQRLYHALVALPFLAPSWQARVLAAEQQRDVEKLARTFDRVPLVSMRLAAKASFLLFAMDEADGVGPAELDGERAHHVRVGLVDLATETLLLRLRRRVDPSWLSPTVRAEYASGIDGCSLALDVHASLAAANSSPAP